MNISSNSPQFENIRINNCEVCEKNKAKYTCPRCELRTCSLECVKIHKKELECSGLRDKVKFKMLKHLNNIDILNDYRFLEETARVISKSVKLPPVSCYSSRTGTLPTDLYRLKCTASNRGVHLDFLPPSFSRHHTNTSYLDYETQNLYWRIDWVFVQAGNMLFTDEHVLDSSPLSSCLQKYIDPEHGIHPALSYYQAAGLSRMCLLLKAEKTVCNRYHVLDPTTMFCDNLDGKVVIEFPVIYVVLSDHIYMFNIFTEEEEQNMLKKQRRRRYSNRKKKIHLSKSDMLLSNDNGNNMAGLGSDKEILTNEHFDIGQRRDVIGRFKQYPRLTQRKRGSGHYNFKNKWNGKRGRNLHFLKSNSVDDIINNVLANNFSSVCVQAQ